MAESPRGLSERYDPQVASRRLDNRPEGAPVLRQAGATRRSGPVIHVAMHLVVATEWAVVGLAAAVAVPWSPSTLL